MIRMHDDVGAGCRLITLADDDFDDNDQDNADEHTDDVGDAHHDDTDDDHDDDRTNEKGHSMMVGLPERFSVQQPLHQHRAGHVIDFSGR